MKTVYPTDEIAHLWAHQTQSEARNPQNNFFFLDSTIYSYGSHFPIARHVKNKRGESAVLFTTHGYSNTTAKHLCKVRQAISHLDNVFNVDQVRDNDATYNRKEQLRDYQKRIVALLASAKKARTNAPRLLEEAEKLMAEANAYSKFFSLRKTFGTPADFSKLVEKAEADRAKANRANAKRDAERKERDRLEAIERCNKCAERLRAWSNGEGTSSELPHDWQQFFTVRLRVIGDEIQTSQGASVPLSHGQRVYKAVKACRDAGTSWTRNGERIPVGVFQVDRIEADGTLHAGCHHVTWDEINRLAIAQGWSTSL